MGPGPGAHSPAAWVLRGPLCCALARGPRAGRDSTGQGPGAVQPMGLPGRADAPCTQPQPASSRPTASTRHLPQWRGAGSASSCAGWGVHSWKGAQELGRGSRGSRSQRLPWLLCHLPAVHRCLYMYAHAHTITTPPWPSWSSRFGDRAPGLFIVGRGGLQVIVEDRPAPPCPTPPQTG